MDSDRWPYKGVKGRGRAKVVPNKEQALSHASKILVKYVKKGQPLIESVLEKVKAGGYVVFEITPAYFTSWDYAKLVPQAGRDFRNAVMS